MDYVVIPYFAGLTKNGNGRRALVLYSTAHEGSRKILGAVAEQYKASAVEASAVASLTAGQIADAFAALRKRGRRAPSFILMPTVRTTPKALRELTRGLPTGAEYGAPRKESPK